MPLKTDSRTQLNLKGAGVTTEFVTMLRIAADRQGQGVAEFVVTTMTAEAQRVLKGEATLGAAVPARPEDVADQLAGPLMARMEELAQQQAAEALARHQALADEMREDRARQRREARRGRWR